jgi:hypothetical protein
MAERGVPYDVKSIAVPRLAGATLRALAVALEVPGLSSLLLARLL